jgi:hypothetical protein
MKLYSTDKTKFVEIILDNFGGVPFIEAVVDFGIFQGGNSSIHLENPNQFIRDFDSYITDRSINPVLKGTYDFQLSFYAKSLKTFLKVNIGDINSSPSGTEWFGVYGEFAIDDEYLIQYLEHFKGLN